jgi:hypothetical protein
MHVKSWPRLGLCVIAACLIYITGLGATSIEYNKDDVWETRAKLIAAAKNYLGTPYRLGGKSSKGLDCSGLVYVVYKEVTGQNLLKPVKELIRLGEPVSGLPAPGDLVFFDTGGGPSHVGISLGGKTFYHAASDGPRTGVTLDSLDTTYYKSRYLGARSILKDVKLTVNMVIDSKPARQDFNFTYPPGKPIYFYVDSKWKLAKSILVKVNKDDLEFFTRRIWLEPDGEPAPFWFIPASGMWEVQLWEEAADPEAGKENQVAAFYFRSGEMQ